MKTRNILIIEDEKLMSMVLCSRLSKDEYHVDVASNGNEAIEYVSNAQYDLILLDLVIPQIDGFAVLQTIRNNSLNQTTKVLVMSNLDREYALAKLSGLEFDDLIIKSDYSLRDIASKIQSLFDVFDLSLA